MRCDAPNLRGRNFIVNVGNGRQLARAAQWPSCGHCAEVIDLSSLKRVRFKQRAALTIASRQTGTVKNKNIVEATR
jgi:hypothetical protein